MYVQGFFPFPLHYMFLSKKTKWLHQGLVLQGGWTWARLGLEMFLSSKGVELFNWITYREWLSRGSKWLWWISSHKLPRWPLTQPSNLVVTGGHWRPATELLHQKKKSAVETVCWAASAGSWEVNGVVVKRSKLTPLLQGFSWWHVLGGIWKGLGLMPFAQFLGTYLFGISLEGIHRHLQKSSLSQVTLTLTALPALLGPLRPLRLGYMEMDDTRVRSKLDSSNWFRCSLCVRWTMGRFVCVPKRLAWNSIAWSSQIWRLCPDISESSCSTGGWGISIYEAMPQRARTTLTASYTRCSGLVSCQFLESNSPDAFCVCRSWNKYSIR